MRRKTQGHKFKGKEGKRREERQGGDKEAVQWYRREVKKKGEKKRGMQGVEDI